MEEKYPDEMSTEEISLAVKIILARQKKWRDNLVDLEKLGDRQWHTYEIAEDEIKCIIENWINKNWENISEYAEMALGLAYCFGLTKSLFSRALAQYSGIHREEFEEMLDQSHGANIDPYWSLRQG